MSKYTEAKLKVAELELDKNNPRFSELYTGGHDEDSLIKYLLHNEAAADIAKEIVEEGGFYNDRPLWVIKQGVKYIVKDGNRRCSAVKALDNPGQYDLDYGPMRINTLPVLIYHKEEDVNKRIFKEHAHSTFRSWERISKALAVYKLFKDGTSVSSMRDIDSSPGQLIKLADFYFEAVKIGGDDFRNLLARKDGKTGGRATIFERLFAPKYSSKCGYSFKNSPYFQIEIDDMVQFKKYVKSIVNLLTDDKKYEIKTDTVDDEKVKFLDRLKEYGFDPEAKPSMPEVILSGPNSGATGATNDGTSTPVSTGSTSSGGNSGTSGSSGNGSTKKFPILKRKKLPPGIKERISEYFKLDADEFTNAKVAMSRITFECVLKYVIENTKFNGKTTIHKTSPFNTVYAGKHANATLMKVKFTELIMNVGDQNAFKNLNLDDLHQIIHNYKVGALVKDARQISNNMMHLIEFLLQDEADLLNSLDLKKLT